MHYTSVESIHKVIDPLFLDDLRAELGDVLAADKSVRGRRPKLEAFRDKLAGLTFLFLDPACGSGNFLTETYLSLRRLENEAIRAQSSGQNHDSGAKEGCARHIREELEECGQFGLCDLLV